MLPRRHTSRIPSTSPIPKSPKMPPTPTGFGTLRGVALEVVGVLYAFRQPVLAFLHKSPQSGIILNKI